MFCLKKWLSAFSEKQKFFALQKIFVNIKIKNGAGIMWALVLLTASFVVVAITMIRIIAFWLIVTTIGLTTVTTIWDSAWLVALAHTGCVNR